MLRIEREALADRRTVLLDVGQKDLREVFEQHDVGISVMGETLIRYLDYPLEVSAASEP